MTTVALPDLSTAGNNGTYGVAGDITGCWFGRDPGYLGGINYSIGGLMVACETTKTPAVVPLSAGQFSGDFTLWGEVMHPNPSAAAGQETEVFNATDAGGTVIQVLVSAAAFSLQCTRWYDAVNKDVVSSTGAGWGFGPHTWIISYKASTGQFNFYEDSANIGSPAAVGAHAQTRTATTAKLGKANNPTLPAWTGFGEVILFPSELTPAQISTLWAARTTSAGFVTAALALAPTGFYRLNQAAGWHVGDGGMR
jgi:hypothetical protein